MLPAPGLVSLSLAFLLIPPFTVTFQVQSDTLEVVVVVGSDAVLPCTLSPPSSADRLEIRWFYNLFHTVLYLLKNGREDRQQQSVQYRNRAWVRSGPKTGDLTLSLLNVQLHDAGTYHCFVEDEADGTYEEAVTQLKVIGIGSPPLVKVSLQGSSVLLSCSSSDWFPEPKMNWKSEDGTLNYTGVMESHTQSDGLVSISSNIIIEDSSKGSLYCDIKHPVNGKETGVYVIVSESLFPVISTWTILLSLLLVLSLVVITVIAWKFHLYCKEKERQLNAKETILNLQKQEIEWRKAAVHKESILFDPLTAYRNLIISPDYCVITTAGHEQNATPNEKRFDTEPCVLAQYSYNSGKHYWETEIQERGSQFWSLGIAKESIRRSGGQRESPEAGIWVIRASTDGFFGLSSPPNKILPSQRPNIVGILLNYEDGSLSFYNANTYELLFQFVDISIAEEPVFPFYYIGDGITFVLNPLK